MNSIRLADSVLSFSSGRVAAGFDMLFGAGLDGKSVSDNPRFANFSSAAVGMKIRCEYPNERSEYSDCISCCGFFQWSTISS